MILKPGLGLLPDLNHWSISDSEGFWTFMEGGGEFLRDSSVKDRASTYSNFLWSSSNTGRCISFDGLPRYLDIPNDQMSFQVPYTCVIKLLTIGGSNLRALTRYTGSSDKGLEIRTGSTETDLEISNTTSDYFCTTSISLDTWYTVVAVFDRTEVRMYLNGVQVDEDTSPTYTNENLSTNVYLGRNVAGNYWAGEIEYVNFINRALTDSEIFTMTTNPYQAWPVEDISLTSSGLPGLGGNVPLFDGLIRMNAFRGLIS